MEFKNLLLVAVYMLALCSSPVQAYIDGDYIIRGGIIKASPNDESDNIESDGSKISATVGLDSDTELGLSFTYMVRDNFGIELLLAAPFTHQLKGKGSFSSVGKFAETKYLSPSLSLQYYPMSHGSIFQPYLGVGLNYTMFYDELFINGNSDDFQRLTLEDSVGLTAQAGFDYKLNNKWSLNAAVWYMNVNTSAEFKNNTSTQYKVDFDIDPWVYMAGISYQF